MKRGFSLIEVLIAVAIISIGVLAAALSITTMLTGTRRAVERQLATQVAEAEIDHQRERAVADVATTNCATGNLPNGYSCEVEVTSCNYDTSSATPEFVCNGGEIDPDAYQINVTVTYQVNVNGTPTDVTVEMTSLKTALRLYLEEL